MWSILSNITRQQNYNVVAVTNFWAPFAFYYHPEFCGSVLRWKETLWWNCLHLVSPPWCWTAYELLMLCLGGKWSVQIMGHCLCFESQCIHRKIHFLCHMLSKYLTSKRSEEFCMNCLCFSTPRLPWKGSVKSVILFTYLFYLLILLLLIGPVIPLRGLFWIWNNPKCQLHDPVGVDGT